MSKKYLAIGLMSGTSCDGIDVALIETDGDLYVKPLESLTVNYDKLFQARLLAAVNNKKADKELEKELTLLHFSAIKTLFNTSKYALENIDIIGFHGHTIFHDPKNKITDQIGDGKLLANLCKINVVNDFRSNDVSQGGQGAPLVPIYHRALFKNKFAHDIAVINIGGVANITIIGKEDELSAFDTGPGNALIDDYVRSKTSSSYDDEGKIGSSGKINQNILAKLLNHPYFKIPPPKSLDRNQFDVNNYLSDLTIEDAVATLTEFTASTIINSLNFYKNKIENLIITGGGRHNKYLLTRLEANKATKITNIDLLGHEGNATEAEAFAYLAVRNLLNLPISFPGTTGISAPMSGGRFFAAG